jgi:hypothetical protein
VRAVHLHRNCEPQHTQRHHVACGMCAALPTRTCLVQQGRSKAS